MNFKGMDIVSIRDLSREQIEQVLDLSEKMIPYAKGEKISKALDGKILANLFFEPSTRTRMSFESAMMRLGGSISDMGMPSMTSISKGETLADTIRMVEVYSDVIVLRHPQGGSGQTGRQVLLQTGHQRRGWRRTAPDPDAAGPVHHQARQEGHRQLKVVMVGDLKYGRTVHSLAEALGLLRGGPDVRGAVDPADAQGDGQAGGEAGRKAEARPTAWRRSSPTRTSFTSPGYRRRGSRTWPSTRRWPACTASTSKLLREAKSDLIVMHPLPRVDEIAPEVDDTPHAKYFEQAFNGVPVRMALLNLVLGGEL